MSRATGDGKPGPVVPFPLEEGTCYLVKGKSIDSSYRAAQSYARNGVPVLCVSRIHPDRLRAKYGLENATVWWITGSPGPGHFDPTAVGTLSSEIEEFMDDHPDGCLVLLDGIEYVTIHLGFAKALLFLEHLNEHIMPRRATMLVPADPDCFEPTEFARLDRFTGSLTDEELRDFVDSEDPGDVDQDA